MAYERRGFKGGVRATTIPSGINDAVTTIPGADLSTWSGTTTNGAATATINRGQSDEETVTFTGVSGGNLTGVTRGAAGTTAQSHGANAMLEHTSSKVDFDEANAHIADTTLDHHTQYLRTDGTRVGTGLQSFSAQPGTTHESNRVDARTQVYGRGVAIAADNVPHQGGITFGLSVSVGRATPAASFNNASGDSLRTYAGSTLTTSVDSSGTLHANGGLRSGGDPAGVAGYTTISNALGIGVDAAANLQAPAKGAGTGPASLTAVSWVKVYLGTAAHWLPAFT